MSSQTAGRPPTVRPVRYRPTWRPTWRPQLRLLGPAFVAAIAYLDPGNFATDYAAGSQCGYQLLWVVVVANLAGMLVQHTAAKVGIVGGAGLAELCRARFGRRANRLLWLQAEAIATATDLAEFVGAAVGLNLVFGLPMLPAALVTAGTAFGVLACEQLGARYFERLIVALLGLVGGGLIYLVCAGEAQDYASIAAGLVPRLRDGHSVTLAVAIIGATVMPHAVYLHSALPGRVVDEQQSTTRRTRLRYNTVDCLVGLGLAGVLNALMLCAAAAMPASGSGGFDLGAIHDRIATLLGGSAALAFAVALLTSGVASSSVGTFAGQVVMAGFVQRQLPVVARRAITMLPSLVVLGLSIDTSSLLLYSQAVLCFGLPFALAPLLLISRDPAVMGELRPGRLAATALSATTGLIIAVDLWLVVDLLV